MKNFNLIKYFSFLAFFALFLNISCSDDSVEEEQVVDPTDPQEMFTFEQVIQRGGDFDAFPQSRTEEVKSTSEPNNEDYEEVVDGEEVTQRYECVTTTVSVSDGNGQFPLFNTAADVIYPGSLLQGSTLGRATPSPIVVKRAGGTISYNLNNGNLTSSFEVEEVKKSSVQDAMNNIISGAAGTVVPSNFQLDIIQVESESQLALEMGIDIETYNAQISSDMSFSSDRTYNRSLIKLNQSYYTMSFDLPTGLDEIFDPSVTPSDLAVYVQEDNPAAFISSVTYGRIFYMLVESTSSRQEMDAQLNVAYSAFQNSAEGDLAVSAMNSLQNLKIKVVAYGGDAEGSFELAGITDVNEIGDKLAKSTNIAAGLPLSYVVRSVERPDIIVGTSLATEYDVVNCELKGVLAPSTYASWVDLYDDGIGALLNINSSHVFLFNAAGDKYAWFNAIQQGLYGDGSNPYIYDVNDADAPLGNIGFNVGGSIRHTETGVYLIDKDGAKMHSFQVNTNAIPSPGGTVTSGMIGSYSFQNGFTSQIFGSRDNYRVGTDGLGDGVRTGINSFIQAYFSRDGKEYQEYFPEASPAYFSDITETENWYNQTNPSGKTLFESIAGVSRYFLSSSGNNGTETYIFVSADGTQLMEYIPGSNNQFNGPWLIN